MIERMASEAVHVMLGTKAQYIKTAPVVHELLERHVPVRIIDLGQHGELAETLRAELELPPPDICLGGATDVVSIPQALRWAARVGRQLVVGRRRLFPMGGWCLVHGDTPSTLLSVLLARRYGLPVAHLEAGLRSPSLLEPFPEEAIRRAVTRLSAVLYAPDDEASDRLRGLRIKGQVVPTGGNTSRDALTRALHGSAVASSGPAVFTMHRVENLHRRDRVERFVRVARDAAATGPVVFVVHGPTWDAIGGHRAMLVSSGVELVDLLPHRDFTRLLSNARFVVTDGGSIQEECAQLGVPTLLWRAHTERSDGLDQNVILSCYSEDEVARFLANPDQLRVPPQQARSRFSPSARVAEDLRRRLRAPSESP